MLPRRLVTVLAGAAATVAATAVLTACTSSGGSSSTGSTPAGTSGTPASSAPAAPSTPSSSAAALPPGPWTKQVAGQQLNALLYTFQQKSQAAAVDPSAPFDQLRASLQALSSACDDLVSGVRAGSWPAEAKAQATAFADVQDEECRVDAKFAAATTPQAFQAVPRLPSDHSQKVFDARLALENALGL